MDKLTAKKPVQKKKKPEPIRTISEYKAARMRIPSWAIFILVPAIALLTRALYLWQAGRSAEFSLLVGDAVTYDQWARRIAGGDWLGNGVFYQAPLYPYFLGALYSLFGRDFGAVRFVQILIGAGSCLLLAIAGRSFFHRTRTGLLAGILLAVYPTAIFFDGSIQKSVLDLFFVCALLAVLGKLLESPRNSWWLSAGVLMGFLGLTRENALLFAPIILAWLFISRRNEFPGTRLRWAGLFLLGSAVVLLPVGWRNLRVGGEFHLTTAQFGPNFYIGNGRSATGFYEPLQEGRGHAMFEREDATRLAEQAAGRKLTPSEVSNYWALRALNEIRADIGRWLRLLFRKWLLVWNISEVGDSDDPYTYGDWSPLLGGLNRLLHFGVLCPLAVLGICLTWNSRRDLWLLLAMILGYAASAALFYVFSRYRFPLVPMLILFAAAGLTSLGGALRRSPRRQLWIGAAMAFAAGAVCNHAMMPEARIRAGTRINFGNAFLVEGRVQDAIEQYEQALRLNPKDPNVPVNLATALLRAGRFAEAVAYYEQALRINPDDAIAHYNAGAAWVRLGKPVEATRYFEQALRIAPDYAEAHVALGSALFDQGRTPEAMEHWDRALEIKPGFSKAHYNIANALLRQDRLKEAMDHYQQALKTEPDFAEAHCNLGIALEKAGRVQEAIEHYEQAVLLRPDFSDVRKRLELLRPGTPGNRNAP
jgi:tetratricopeptide (TPR) repeat protein